MQVILELFVCAHDGGNMVRYNRSRQDISESGENPDREIASMLEKVGIGESESPLCSHSTSWRYDSGKTILTYLVWVGRRSIIPLPHSLLAVDSVPRSEAEGPLAPRPGQIREEDVLVHGLRHLSFLACVREDSIVYEAAMKTGSLDFFQALSPEPAGRIKRAS